MKYTGEYTKEISFPLGGIGTGSIGLDGSGRLIDWEIFNRPSKGSSNSYSYFAVKTVKDGKSVVRILNGDVTKDFGGRYGDGMGYGSGYKRHMMAGFPHFKKVEFDGEFPVAVLTFSDGDFPAGVTMTAFNPLIPGDADNSSIPAAFFEIAIHNTDSEELCYQVAFSVSNPYEVSDNKSYRNDGCTFLTLANGGDDKNSVGYGDLTVASDSEITYSQSHWYRGGWVDEIISFWNEFDSVEPLKPRTYDTPGRKDTGTIVSEFVVAPGEIKKVRFVLSWNVPNNHNYWTKDIPGIAEKIWKNYYATRFADSAESALYALKNWDELYRRTSVFKNALYSSSLPAEVIDAAASSLSVLKSPTVLRLEDGSFYGWEGVAEKEGLCEGTCQHVWNYAYALCFLFPDLERSVRNNEFRYSTDHDGRMSFRMRLPQGSGVGDFRACLDGQMGTVIKCFREWKISGDNQWLRDNWDNIKNVLEYAWNEQNPDMWDADKDGVLEGRQHHTLDVELFGPCSWLEGMYLAALSAASQMAEFLGDKEKAEEYKALFKKGYIWTRDNLFNGRYFIHKIDVNDKSIIEKFPDFDFFWNEEVNQIKYQIADGSSIDQMLAQWHSGIVGLDDIFDKKQILTALESMMKYNYKPCIRNVVNKWRNFALNDEAGTIICEYPDDVKKPDFPIPYCDETMTGFEYAFAGLLLLNGKIDDGLSVVRAVRERYDGRYRNPWNEMECGSNYARSMASFALVPIMSGFEFDMPRYHIGFNPIVSGDFRCFWSLGKVWGIFEIVGNNIKVNVLEGSIELCSVGLNFCDAVRKIMVDGVEVSFSFDEGRLNFEKMCITECLEIEI